MEKRTFLLSVILMLVSVGAFANVVTSSDSVIINEFTYNSEYYDNEWVELYNASHDTVNILGWSLIDGVAEHIPAMIPDTCDTLLAPGEYFTIWTGGDGMDHGYPLHFTPDLNLGWDYATSTEITTIGLNNSGDILYLRDSTETVVDSVNFLEEETFPDAARWGVGATCELIDPLLDNNDPNNWAASYMYGGTPGSPNQVMFDVPKILITEVMYNSAGSDYEFVELMNADVDTVDIEGYWVMDDSPLHTKLPIPDTCDTKLGPGDFFTILLARGSDPGFVPDYDISTAGNIGLNNDKDNIVLFNASDTMVTYMHYDDGSSSYAEFAHAKAADGKGPSLEIVDVTKDPQDPMNWQASVYDGGSPGTLNATPASLVSADVVDINKVDLTFSEPVDSIESVTKTNYEIDHGIGNPDTVIWMSETMVELTVSEIRWDTTYALAVWNVSDVESGTPIPDSTVITYGRYKPDSDPPVVLKVNAMTDSTVIVVFDEEVDSTTAVALTNYTIDNSIGNPISALWMGDEVALELGSKLTLDATYNLAVSGIEDLYENVMVTASIPFILKDYSGKIIINEFTYNSEFYDNEWIELYNNSSDTIDIAGWGFQNSLDPDVLIIADTIDTQMEPGSYWTVWLYADPLSRGYDWPLHFTPDWNAAWDWTDSVKIHVFNLWNSGSDISLYDDAGRTVDYVSYMEEEDFVMEAKWGVGITCERIDPDGPSNDPDNWMASWEYGGTPGAANVMERPVFPDIRINEIMYNGTDGSEWVELKNFDDVAVDISGWWMRRDNPTLPKCPFPDGSILQSGDLYTIKYSGELTFAPDFDLAADSSGIYLSNGRDNVILFNDNDLMVTYVHYDDGGTNYYEFAHCEGTDGGGHSLEYWNKDLLNWDPQAWDASPDSGGSPGVENFIPDIIPPVVDSAMAISDTTVRVYFNEEVNYTTAVNKNNYTIDNGIGNPLYNLLETGNLTVVLYLNPASPLVEGTNYTVTVTGVMDLAGNEIAENNTATFVGPAEVVGIVEEVIPKVFALHKNFPNPFNPITTINYDLPRDANVRIVIYDLMGHEIRTLVNTHQKAGYQTIQWNALDNAGRNVSSGFYFYVMDSGDFHKTQKMLLLK